MKTSQSRIFTLLAFPVILNVTGLISTQLRLEPASYSRADFREAPKATPPGTGAGFSDGVARYRIDASQSKFVVHAFAGGLLSALAHNHNIAVRDFTGEAQFTYVTFEPASLSLSVKADSLTVIDKVSQKDRTDIERTMREEVLETGKYPEILFKSTRVSATKLGEGKYRARISGNLALHGETHAVEIDAEIELGANSLRARGEIPLKQTRFNIKPVSIAGGTIKVKDEVKLSFDIIAH